MINLNQLSFTYRKRKPLFTDLNLNMEQGNIYGLLGKNGAGKSTLLKIIAGLLHPKSGECEVMGHIPANRHPQFLSELYFVTEELHVPPLKIRQYKDLYAPFYANFSDEQFSSYIQQFDIDENWVMSKLSHGQKKKVILSFGLASNCKLLMMDEPTNGLDIPSKGLFRQIIASAITDERTFIISTHQVRDIANMIDPIIILEDSKILLKETLESITQKLSFNMHFGTEIPANALYHERIPGGYQVVTPNTNGEETEVELESLFNAVVANKAKIQELFATVNHNETV